MGPRRAVQQGRRQAVAGQGLGLRQGLAIAHQGGTGPALAQLDLAQLAAQLGGQTLLMLGLGQAQGVLYRGGGGLGTVQAQQGARAPPRRLDLQIGPGTSFGLLRQLLEAGQRGLGIAQIHGHIGQALAAQGHGAGLGMGGLQLQAFLQQLAGLAQLTQAPQGLAGMGQAQADQARPAHRARQLQRPLEPGDGALVVMHPGEGETQIGGQGDGAAQLATVQGLVVGGGEGLDGLQKLPAQAGQQAAEVVQRRGAQGVGLLGRGQALSPALLGRAAFAEHLGPGQAGLEEQAAARIAATTGQGYGLLQRPVQGRGIAPVGRQVVAQPLRIGQAQGIPRGLETLLGPPQQALGLVQPAQQQHALGFGQPQARRGRHAAQQLQGARRVALAQGPGQLQGQGRLGRRLVARLQGLHGRLGGKHLDRARNSNSHIALGF